LTELRNQIEVLERSRRTRRDFSLLIGSSESGSRECIAAWRRARRWRACRCPITAFQRFELSHDSVADCLLGCRYCGRQKPL